MTKRQAILALLAAPAGLLHAQVQLHGDLSCAKTIPAPGQDGFVVGVDFSTCPERRITQSVRIELSDAQYSRDPIAWNNGQIDRIVVAYNGQERVITAREIWDALAPEDKAR